MDKLVHAPFETRTPVSGAGFHDRARLLEQLTGLAQAHLDGQPSWVVLLGPRKIGKTSLLAEARRRATGSGDLVVHVDLLRTDARVQDVFAALVTHLLAAACASVGRRDLEHRLLLPPQPPSAGLVHDVSGAIGGAHVGAAFETLELLRRRSVSHAAVEAALDLPGRFAAEHGPTWVVFDEFQEIEALNRQRPFSKRHTVYRLMRSVWQTHERVSYWATGSQVSMLTSLFTDRRAPFHGHFRLVPVGPFDAADGADLLLERLCRGSRPSEAERAAAFAAEALGGHPFYLQVLGEEMLLRRVPLTTAAVKSVLQELLLEPAGRLALHLRGVIEADVGGGQKLAVLRCLARRPATLAELVAANRSLSKDSAHGQLTRLSAADLVTRDRDTGRFRVADPALAALLRVEGYGAEPAPSVLGDEGERAAARDLSAQGIRPVYQSYRSLGPADLLSLGPGPRFAIQVKRTPLPVYVTEAQFQRLRRWAESESMTPLLCQVEPGDLTTVRYWRWRDGRRAGRRRRFDEEGSTRAVWSLHEE